MIKIGKFYQAIYSTIRDKATHIQFVIKKGNEKDSYWVADICKDFSFINTHTSYLHNEKEFKEIINHPKFHPYIIMALFGEFLCKEIR